MTTTLLLVRHGETDWNAAGRIQGQIDIELNAVGLAQAAQLAGTLRDESFDAIYSSDLMRARQTVEPLLEHRAVSVVYEPRLRERHFGRLQGMSRPEIVAQDAEAARQLESRDTGADFSGGESLRTFHRRCTTVLNEIVARHSAQRVLIVAHGGVLDSIYRHATGTTLAAVRTFGLRNAALNRLSVVTRDPVQFEVVIWDDTSHLAATRDETGPIR